MVSAHLYYIAFLIGIFNQEVSFPSKVTSIIN